MNDVTLSSNYVTQTKVSRATFIGRYFELMTDQIVVFALDEQPYALPLPAVVKVIHAVEITCLPKAPEIITGIIDVKGQIIPVADIRKRFGLPSHEIQPDDRLIIVQAGLRRIAILVDTVTGIRDLEPRQLELAAESFPFGQHILGVGKVEDGLVVIYDLQRFLSLNEEQELMDALKSETS